jgi:hypothetical protein
MRKTSQIVVVERGPDNFCAIGVRRSKIQSETARSKKTVNPYGVAFAGRQR